MGEMNIMTGILVFTFLWWAIFFITLPIGIRHDDKESVKDGHDAGAPDKPKLWWKVLASTVGATVLFFVWWYLLDTGIFSVVN